MGGIKDFARSKALKGMYIMPEAGFGIADFRTTVLIDTGGPSPYSFANDGYVDDIGVRRTTAQLSIAVGAQLQTGRLVLDAWLGFGVRYRSVVHYDLDFPDKSLQATRHYNAHNNSIRQGATGSAIFPANFSLGYRF